MPDFRSIFRVLGAAVAVVVVFAAVACGSGENSETAQPTTTPVSGAEGAKVADIVRAKMRDLDLSSAVFGVWRGDTRMAFGALGESPLGVPATPDMRLRVGQPMEPMLSTILLQLDASGALRLDEPIARWEPDFPRADKITPRMLADSTSGISDYVTDPEFVRRFYADPFHTWTAEEILALATARPPLFDPGAGWAYAHSDLVLLGEVLQRATGKSLGDLIQQHILDPLAMRDSAVVRTAQIGGPILHGYTNERKVFEDSTFWNPTAFLHSGNMNSTVSDIGGWVRALGTGKLLTRTEFDTMMAPSTAGMGPMADQKFFAFGVGHIGDWLLMNPAYGGYHGVGLYDRSTRTTIVVYATLGPNSNANTDNAVPIGAAIGAALVPDHPPQIP